MGSRVVSNSKIAIADVGWYATTSWGVVDLIGCEDFLLGQIIRMSKEGEY